MESISKHFACQDSGLSHIFKVIVSTSEKIPTSINSAHFPLPSVGQKRCMLKLPITSRKKHWSTSLGLHFRKKLVQWRWSIKKRQATTSAQGNFGECGFEESIVLVWEEKWYTISESITLRVATIFWSRGAALGINFVVKSRGLKLAVTARKFREQSLFLARLLASSTHLHISGTFKRRE